MALDTFNPYLFISAGEQSNKILTPTYADGIAQFQAQRAQELTGLTVRIDPIQEGTGDPAPDNIRPISGRTGLTVTVQSGETQNEYPVTWETEAGAIYGGTLDVVSGVLTVDRAIITLDGSQNVFMSQSNRGYVQVADAMQIDASNQTTEKSVVCDRLKSETWAGLGYSSGNLCCAPLYGNGVAFRNDEITTAADWKAYFQSNPTQFSYKLATPQTYQLTPTEIKTLPGFNQIYSDAGPVIDIKF